jgi:hypothetical protein
MTNNAANIISSSKSDNNIPIEVSSGNIGGGISRVNTDPVIAAADRLITMGKLYKAKKRMLKD